MASPGAGLVDTEWFVLGTADVPSTAPVGLLEQTWLHPLSLLGTPYAALCANSTHREEVSWQFKVFITTAGMTGARIGVIPVTDPTYTGQLNTDLVWGQICNGRGVMADVSGNSSVARTFHITGSTRVLSNAEPPASGNYLGYADAAVVIWVLQPPLGMARDTSLQVTTVARCRLRLKNPAPGFLASQMHTPGPGPDPTPQPSPDPGRDYDWQLNVTGAGTGEVSSKWLLSHTGDAWLAGGYYFQFYQAGGAMPGNVDGLTLSGHPLEQAVYVCDHAFPEWQTAWGVNAIPKYFVIYWGPISHTVCLVGFTEYDHAKEQADGNTGAIPRNAELAIRYSKPPTWREFLGDYSSTVTCKFQKVYEAGWSSSVYRSGNTELRTLVVRDQAQQLGAAATGFRDPTLAQASARCLPTSGETRSCSSRPPESPASSLRTAFARHRMRYLATSSGCSEPPSTTSTTSGSNLRDLESSLTQLSRSLQQLEECAQRSIDSSSQRAFIQMPSTTWPSNRSPPSAESRASTPTCEASNSQPCNSWPVESAGWTPQSNDCWPPPPPPEPSSPQSYQPLALLSPTPEPLQSTSDSREELTQLVERIRAVLSDCLEDLD